MKNFILNLSLISLLSLGCFLGCSKPPEKTQDPDEIEELRQEHKSMAEREAADG